MIRASRGLLGLVNPHLKRPDRILSDSNAFPIAEDVCESRELPIELLRWNLVGVIVLTATPPQRNGALDRLAWALLGV